MGIQKKQENIFDKAINFLTIMLLSGFVILEMQSWGKYLFLIISFVIFLVDGLENGIFQLMFGKYQIMFGLFILYSATTVLWAMSRSNVIEFCVTLIMILTCLTFIYPHYSRCANLDELLTVIIWSSYLIAIYTILFYGIDQLIAASQSGNMRLGNDYSNINTIGMFCAAGLVIWFDQWIHKKKKIDISFVLACVSLFVVACTQSRKGILYVVIGVVGIVIINNYDNKDFLKTIFKLLLVIMLCLSAIFMISRIAVFNGVRERLGQLFSIFTGKGELDSGAINRQKMIQLGWKIWLENPIGGIGLNCPRLIVSQSMGFNAYMHNNFIELLCGTGLIGFLIYYAMHVYLFFQYFKYREANKQMAYFGILWLVIMLIMDYGMVSYYSKTSCFFLMTHFLIVANLKKEYDTKKGEKTLCDVQPSTKY